MTTESFKHLSIDALQQRQANETLTIVDIRDGNAFANGRIPGAIHLTNENIADFLRDADFDAPTVVCCYHGISSQQAAQFLISQDFTDVYSLDGGFSQWLTQHPDNIER